jgi:aquaporin related protein
MSGEGPSELPIHYGERSTNGELIKRPTSPTIPSSPIRAYHPGPRGLNFSPEPTPIESSYPDSENIRAGLRRRPSHQTPMTPMRRHSGGEYDYQQRPSFDARSSQDRRPLRARDDSYWREDDPPMSRSRVDDYRPHPDMREKSRPPRTYRNDRNVEAWDRGPGSASKPYFEDSRGDFRGNMDPDLERGGYGYAPQGESPYKPRSLDQESIDGYNYDLHKRTHHHRKSDAKKIDFTNLSDEERRQVMRLPWTQWMNSDIKNRKLLCPSIFPSLIRC